MHTGKWVKASDDEWHVAVTGPGPIEPGDLVKVVRKDGTTSIVAVKYIVRRSKGVTYIAPIMEEPSFFKIGNVDCITVIGDDYKPGDVVYVKDLRRKVKLTDVILQKGSFKAFRYEDIKEKVRYGTWVRIDPRQFVGAYSEWAVGVSGPMPEVGEEIQVIKRGTSVPQSYRVVRVLEPREDAENLPAFSWIVLVKRA